MEKIHDIEMVIFHSDVTNYQRVSDGYFRTATFGVDVYSAILWLRIWHQPSWALVLLLHEYTDGIYCSTLKCLEYSCGAGACILHPFGMIGGAFFFASCIKLRFYNPWHLHCEPGTPKTSCTVPACFSFIGASLVSSPQKMAGGMQQACPPQLEPIPQHR